jgi:Fe-Mn family superoxide dismutase
MFKFDKIYKSLNKYIMAFELPQLPYAYDALEPYIDARTMEIHHSKHHNAYTNLNAAAAGTDMEGKTIENILINLDMKNTAVRNNGFTIIIFFGM